ncbi:hypothetical protein [Clostridium baratii]|uniref:hypothetical protein n=1 Tax=Clostridium baratii TaxID=1561 RepID=UPI003D3547F8
MGYLKCLFNYYNKEYLIKSYLVSLFMSFIYINGLMVDGKIRVLFSIKSYKYILIAIIFSLFYPFAKGLYLQIKGSLLSDISVIFANIIVIFIAKVFMAIILWGFSVPLGIINIVLIYFKYNKSKVKIINEDITDEVEWFE